MLDDPLVEALVAAAQQRQLRLGGELLDHPVVEHPPARRQRDDPPPRADRDRVLAVAGAQRRLDDVDPQHHPGAAAERRVVDLAGRERRVGAVVEAGRASEPSAIALATWRWPRNQSNHCGKSVKTSILHASSPFHEAEVDIDRGAPRRRRSGSRRAPSARAGRRRRRARPRAPRTRAAAASAAPPPRAARRRTPRSPRARAPSTRPPRAAAPRPPGSASGAPRSASAASRPAWPASRRIGRSCVPARRSIVREHAAHVHGVAAGQQRRVRPRDVEGAVEPVRSPDPPGLDERREELLRGSSGPRSDREDGVTCLGPRPRHRLRLASEIRPTPRCRRARGGCP